MSITLALLSLFPLPSPAAAETPADRLRVCADPNNLPFSNRAGEGFENKLAEMAASALGRKVEYLWWAQRRGFIRNTLKAEECDVVMGVPKRLEMVATTRPYYRSTYVFVARADRHLDLRSMRDPRLRDLRIGVHLIGDDGFNTPPAQALGEQGIVENVVGFTVYGDYADRDPPARLLRAVQQAEIDLGAVWGPLAGYVAQNSAVPLEIRPITDTSGFAPLAFSFDIAIGLRRGDEDLKQALDAFIAREQQHIDALLDSYGVPRQAVPAQQAREGR